MFFGIHEKQMASSQCENLSIEQSVFSPETKSSKKQQWSNIVNIMFHFPETHDQFCIIIINIIYDTAHCVPYTAVLLIVFIIKL